MSQFFVRQRLPAKYSMSRFRQISLKWYRVKELYLYNVITSIIKECRVSLYDQDLFNLRLVNKDFA